MCHTILSVPCSLVVTCLERADLLAPLCVMCFCLSIMLSWVRQVWYLIVQIDKTKVLKTDGSSMQVRSPCEHSAILLTFIKRLLVLKTIFWWPLKTGFTFTVSILDLCCLSYFIFRDFLLAKIYM